MTPKSSNIPAQPSPPPNAGMALDALAYEQACRALDQQAGVLDELRQRTSTLVAVTTLVATFLGARALDAPAPQHGPIWILVIALLALLWGVTSGVLVLVPTRTRPRRSISNQGSPATGADVVALVFSMNVEVMLDRAEERNLTPPCTPLMDTARTLQLAWNENQPIIGAKQRWFTYGCVALLVQTGAWITFLASAKGVI